MAVALPGAAPAFDATVVASFVADEVQTKQLDVLALTRDKSVADAVPPPTSVAVFEEVMAVEELQMKQLVVEDVPRANPFAVAVPVAPVEVAEDADVRSIAALQTMQVPVVAVPSGASSAIAVPPPVEVADAVELMGSSARQTMQLVTLAVPEGAAVAVAVPPPRRVVAAFASTTAVAEHIAQVSVVVVAEGDASAVPPEACAAAAVETALEQTKQSFMLTVELLLVLAVPPKTRLVSDAAVCAMAAAQNVQLVEVILALRLLVAPGLTLSLT